MRLFINTQNTTAMITKRKGLMSWTIAVHVRYNSRYFSLPSSAKKQREMTSFLTTGPSTAHFSYFYLILNAFVAFQQGQRLIPSNTVNKSKQMLNFNVIWKALSLPSRSYMHTVPNTCIYHRWRLAKCFNQSQPFWRLLWSITEQTHDNMKSACFI